MPRPYREAPGTARFPGLPILALPQSGQWYRFSSVLDIRSS